MNGIKQYGRVLGGSWKSDDYHFQPEHFLRQGALLGQTGCLWHAVHLHFTVNAFVVIM